MAEDPFWGNLFRRRPKEEDELLEILKKVPIFEDLSRSEHQKVAGILHRRAYAADESIVREGEMGVGIYIILSGQVQIVQGSEDGARIRLATFAAGDFFGEQALLEDSPRTASAISVEPSTAMGFFRPDLMELIESNPRLGLKIVMRLSRMISVRLRHTNRLLKEAREWSKQLELQQTETGAQEVAVAGESAVTDTRSPGE